MKEDFIKMAYYLGYQTALEKRAQAKAGIIRRLLRLLIKKPSKAILKAFLDPVLGLSEAGRNAEIRRRTGQWIRNEVRQLHIPAGNGRPARVVDLSGPRSIHLYHRPAAVLHHLFMSGPDAKFNRVAFGGLATGIGGTLGFNYAKKKYDERKGDKDTDDNDYWW